MAERRSRTLPASTAGQRPTDLSGPFRASPGRETTDRFLYPGRPDSRASPRAGRPTDNHLPCHRQRIVPHPFHCPYPRQDNRPDRLFRRPSPQPLPASPAVRRNICPIRPAATLPWCLGLPACHSPRQRIFPCRPVPPVPARCGPEQHPSIHRKVQPSDYRPSGRRADWRDVEQPEGPPFPEAVRRT